MVDLGGWSLHLHCTGERAPSAPAVILEAGAGSFSVEWSLVQPLVDDFAFVCSYDRAGLGWSDLGPHPRTLKQVVWELRTLLEMAEVPPPYLLVGHSAGGILARLYAFTYPSDVVGLVLEESGYESGVRVFQNGQLVRLVDTATGRPVPPVRSSDPLQESDLPPDALQQIQAVIRQLGPRANDPPRDLLPESARQMRAWSFRQVKHWATNENPFEGEELASLLARSTSAPYPLGDMPLVVISRGLPEQPGPQGQAEEEEHERNQQALTLLSRNSRRVIAGGSRHEVLLYEPNVVVTAVRELLDATRP
jgi:pimeloyl-ACP methyl ester carboxylesterase